MKRTYIKPCSEVVQPQNEAIMQIGSPVHNEQGGGPQLSKKNNFIFDDEASIEDEL